MDEPDEYVVLPESSCLLLSASEKALKEKALEYGLAVVEQSPDMIDLDKVFKVISSLRIGRSCSQKDCKILLDGWNALEDMARSIHIHAEESSSCVKNTLQKAYDKLFYGNNLPSVTPPYKTFNPIFSSEERRIMMKYLHKLRNEILATNLPRTAGKNRHS